MTDFRVRSHEAFEAKPMPNWGSEVLQTIDFDSIYYYIKPTEGQAKTWEDLPAEIKNTYDRLGIPEAEKKYLAGVGAQYESEVIYHNLAKDLEDKGVIPVIFLRNVWAGRRDRVVYDPSPVNHTSAVHARPPGR